MLQPVHLVLLRHGQSEWNTAGIFTGWENAPLTAAGEEEARQAGSLLARDALAAYLTIWGLGGLSGSSCVVAG